MFLFWVEIVCLLYCCCVFVICVSFAFMCHEHFFSNREITSRCPHRVGWQVLCFSIRVECSSTLVCHITKAKTSKRGYLFVYWGPYRQFVFWETVMVNPIFPCCASYVFLSSMSTVPNSSLQGHCVLGSAVFLCFLISASCDTKHSN
jgi:hypothetical protein